MTVREFAAILSTLDQDGELVVLGQGKANDKHQITRRGAVLPPDPIWRGFRGYGPLPAIYGIESTDEWEHMFEFVEPVAKG